MLNPNQTLSIVGSFSPSNDLTVNADTRRILHEVFAMAGLGGLILRERAETGVINLNKSVFVSHPQAPMSFIRKLQDILVNPDLKSYEFTGKISLALFASELGAFNVFVTKGKVTYQKAEVLWKTKPVRIAVLENSTFAK